MNKPDPHDYRGRFTEYLDACDKYRSRMSFAPTPEELEEMRKGMTGTCVSVSPIWSLPHIPSPITYESDTDWGYIPPPTIPCKHDWAATGTRKTWCKKCDVDGDLDPMTGITTLVRREKEPKNIIKGED